MSSMRRARSSTSILAALTQHLQAKGDVLQDRHVREERILLKDSVHRPLVGGQVLDLLAIEHDLALGHRLETGDHAQQGGLAAARGPEQGEELVVADIQRHLAEGGDRGLAEAVDLGDVQDIDRCGICCVSQDASPLVSLGPRRAFSVLPFAVGRDAIILERRQVSINYELKQPGFGFSEADGIGFSEADGIGFSDARAPQIVMCPACCAR